ncbi:MAG: ATP-binding protein [Proteobacteria bacterium]|nr:ATP-binding protein [Pseudomonadota bacterium]
MNASTPSSRRGWRFGIRLQLLLALTVLLILPWFGYEYLREVDLFLKSGQERALRVTAKAVATALYERPDVLRTDNFLSLPQAQREADTADFSEAPPGAPDSPPRLPTQPLVVTPLSLPHPSTSLSGNLQQQLENALTPLVPANVRLWVVDRDLHVLARLGSLHRMIDERPPQPFAWSDPWPWLRAHLIEPIYASLIDLPTEDFVDEPEAQTLASAREVESALSGIPMLGQRPTTDRAATVTVATTPIWTGDRVAGAVIVEETTNGILAARNQAFERLFSLLLAAVLLIAVVLIVYASRLSTRIRRLRNEIEHAVDARGRVRTIAASAKAGDEIGDLSRSFSDVLGRLEEAAIYREQIASRLSHELRTPIAVVRSSLENLHEPLSEDERCTYLERAQGGLTRLSHILARMTEASRLDQSIIDAERAEVDLCALLKSSVEGYALAYPDRRFSLRVPDAPCRRFVAPDLIVQMLDKLIANAHEFATLDTPIDISLQSTGKSMVLRVINEGPLPPEGDNAALFEPMVSVRQGKRSDTPHLGLGLYIVRLIAEFHGGTARLSPRDDALGAVATITLDHAPSQASELNPSLHGESRDEDGFTGGQKK